MEQMTITAKIQIIVAETDKFLLDETSLTLNRRWLSLF